MKVAFFCAGFPPEVYAGTEMLAVALAQALVANGDEVVVLATSETPDPARDVSDEVVMGLRVRRLFRRPDEWDGSQLRRPHLLAHAHTFLRDEQPDVVHVHHFAGLGTGHVAQCKDLGLPVVLTCHDLWVTCPRYFRLPVQGITCPRGGDRTPCAPCVAKDLGHPDLGTVRALLQRRDADVRSEVAAATKVTAPSRTAAAMVRELLPYEAPIEVIPHGLLRSAQRSTTRRPGPLRVGTFGNLVEPKGVHELVAAMAGLPAELHLHGAFLVPALEQTVRAAAAAQGTALFCHGRFDERMPHPARDLDLAVFPSKCQETYGLVVDEALAHGVPVVCSDFGALAERAGTPGVVVSALPALRATLRHLVASPDALATLRAAVPASLTSIADAAVRYAALYRACQKAPPRP